MIKKHNHFNQQQFKNSINSNKGKLVALANKKKTEPSLTSSQQYMMEYQIQIPSKSPEYQNMYDLRENESIFSNAFEKKNQENKYKHNPNSKMETYQKSIQQQGLKSIGSARGKSSMLLSLCQSRESINYANDPKSTNSNPSLLKSVRASYPEQFLIKEQTNQIKCMNGDMKKAKYRIRNTNNYYCSRCSIILMQQGHLVQQLQEQSVKQSQIHSPSTTSSSQQSMIHLIDRLNTISQRIQDNLRQSQGQNIKQQVSQMCKDQILLYNSIIESVQDMKKQSIIKYERILTKVQASLKNQQLQLLEKLDQIIKLKNQINACSTLQPENISRYMRQWISQADVIEKYDRLEVKMKKQSIQDQLQVIVNNIYQYLNITSNKGINMRNSLATSISKQYDSKNLFTKMLRESRQKLI